MATDFVENVMQLKMKVRQGLAAALLMGMVSLASASGGGGGGGPAADNLSLEPLVLRLKGNHYMQLKPTLKLAHVEKADYVRASVPIVRHELIKFLIGRDPVEVGSPQFMKDFSDEAAEVINKALRGEYIDGILFDSWLIQ